MFKRIAITIAALAVSLSIASPSQAAIRRPGPTSFPTWGGIFHQHVTPCRTLGHCIPINPRTSGSRLG